MLKSVLFYSKYLNLRFSTNFFWKILLLYKCINLIVQKTTAFLLLFLKDLKYADSIVFVFKI